MNDNETVTLPFAERSLEEADRLGRVGVSRRIRLVIRLKKKRNNLAYQLRQLSQAPGVTIDSGKYPLRRFLELVVEHHKAFVVEVPESQLIDLVQRVYLFAQVKLPGERWTDPLGFTSLDPTAASYRKQRGVKGEYRNRLGKQQIDPDVLAKVAKVLNLKSPQQIEDEIAASEIGRSQLAYTNPSFRRSSPEPEPKQTRVAVWA